MSGRILLDGQRFGKLLVIGYECTRGGRAMWRCRCDCGMLKPILAESLTSGKTKSCGCMTSGQPSPSRKDMVGFKVGRLTVLEYAGRKGSRAVWRCKCECGKETVVTGKDLRTAQTMSCGCLQFASHNKVRNVTHGLSRTPEAYSWSSMMQRCYNRHSNRYEYYGARGIKVHPRYSDPTAGLHNLIADIGKRPSLQHTLNRIRNEGDYEPGNVEWADHFAQMQNTRFNRNLTLSGETMCMAQWARRIGISSATILGRLRRGWPVERTLTTAKMC